MPASPEIGEADSSVRKTKIVFQMESKAQSGTDRAGGVAGEIEKYLAGERNDSGPRIERDQRTTVSKNAIGRSGKHGVCDHNLLEQTQRH